MLFYCPGKENQKKIHQNIQFFLPFFLSFSIILRWFIEVKFLKRLVEEGATIFLLFSHLSLLLLYTFKNMCVYWDWDCKFLLFRTYLLKSNGRKRRKKPNWLKWHTNTHTHHHHQYHFSFFFHHCLLFPSSFFRWYLVFANEWASKQMLLCAYVCLRVSMCRCIFFLFCLFVCLFAGAAINSFLFMQWK